MIRKQVYYTGLLAFICIGLSLFSFDRIVARQLSAWKLLPRPERLTELYFPDHAQLPTTFTPDALAIVRFTIHNQEHQATQYYYILTVQAAGKEQLVGDGTITLAHNDSQNIVQTFSMPTLGDRQEIRVRLQYDSIPFGHEATSSQTQAIHYWVNRAK